jgi:CO/xanthine dehydrogenase FAD-binding subunit
MPFIAHAQIRNRGTFGGSVAHADPAAELPAVCIALDASFRLQSTRGSRSVAARDFYRGLFDTALEPDELLVEVELPACGPRTGFAFCEFARRHGDFALVGAAVSVTLDAEGRCADARIVLFSVGETAVEASAAAAILRGQKIDRELAEGAARVAASEDIDPPSDLHASVEYRRQLTRVLTRRALEEACKRAADVD